MQRQQGGGGGGGGCATTSQGGEECVVRGEECVVRGEECLDSRVVVVVVDGCVTTVRGEECVVRGEECLVRGGSVAVDGVGLRVLRQRRGVLLHGELVLPALERGVARLLQARHPKPHTTQLYRGAFFKSSAQSIVWERFFKKSAQSIVWEALFVLCVTGWLRIQS
eukprot:COSAG02_NODE_478_length_21511_cov_120.811087_10_plen_166_part_00